MILLALKDLPIEDPVIIFTLVLLIILLSPIILRKFKIPGIIGLILAGVIIGPNGLGIMLRDSSIELFGTVGILYIMFLAGLEIDMIQFRKSRNRSVVFGLLTFLLPQTIGTLVAYYVLGLNISTSILLASMFASHTLITYPIIAKLGLTKTEAVTVAIGGTLITNTISLFILSVIVQTKSDSLTTLFWVRLIGLSTITGIAIFWLIPKLSRWFFRTFEGEGYSHFLYVLSIVFIAAICSRLSGMEPIIGAFLAGIALNKLIPQQSPLMNRIEFVGNTLFIPFFLIGVGMLVDLKVFSGGGYAILVAVTMVVVATVTKWLAARATRLIFGYTRHEELVIFGLSNGQAAATLAAVTIGFKIGMFDDHILNGTVIMILVTCLIASFTAEAGGRKMAIAETNRVNIEKDRAEQLLVPVSNPETIEKLMDIALLLRGSQKQTPIFPLTIIKDEEDVEQEVIRSKNMLEPAMKHASAADANVQLVARVDLNIPSGIIRAAKELQITTIIIGWNATMTTKEKIFGTVLDNVLHGSTQNLVVCKLLYSINTYRRIRLFLPPLAIYEPGFMSWFNLLKAMVIQTGAVLETVGTEETMNYLARLLPRQQPVIKTVLTVNEEAPDMQLLLQSVKSDDILVFACARRTNISYNPYLDEIPYTLSKQFGKASFLVIFPEQSSKTEYFSNLQLDDYSLLSYEQNLNLFTRWYRKLTKNKDQN